MRFISLIWRYFKPVPLCPACRKTSAECKCWLDMLPYDFRIDWFRR